MTISDNDKLFIKFAGKTEAEFEKMSEDEQDKVLSDGFKKYKAARKIRGNQDQFETAKKRVPETKKFHQDEKAVYVKKLGAGKSATEGLIVGYIEKTDKYLVISPTGKPDDENKLKISQLDESDILLEPEE
jgi:hypothetical protein